MEDIEPFIIEMYREPEDINPVAAFIDFAIEEELDPLFIRGLRYCASNKRRPYLYSLSNDVFGVYFFVFTGDTYGNNVSACWVPHNHTKIYYTDKKKHLLDLTSTFWNCIIYLGKHVDERFI